MSALGQVQLGLSSASAILSKWVNQWYPVVNKEQATGSVASVRYLNGNFWAFTKGTAVNRSTDGISWTSIWPGSVLDTPAAGVLPTDLNDIAYANGVYVIVGNLSGGTAVILTSTDGETWVRRSTTLATTLNTIAWSPTLGMFLAGGNGGYTVTSSDGITWATGTRVGTTEILKIEWGGTQFGLVSGSGNVIYRSSNGTSFTGATPAAFSVNDICYSANLGLWAVARTTGAGSIVITSPDLISWTPRAITNLSATNSAYGIHWDGTRFIVTTNGGGVGTSTDGVTWTLTNGRVSQQGRVASNGNNILVSNSWNAGGLAYSLDGGYNWGVHMDEQSPPVGFLRSNESFSLLSISYAGGRWWMGTTSAGQMWNSPDYRNWFATPVPVAVTGMLSGVANASGATVPYLTMIGITTGNIGQVLSSLDNGLTWTVRSTGATGTGYHGIATDGVTTVITSNDGKVMSSTDGITWTARTSGTATTITGVTYGGGKFVLVGTNFAAYSADGITWTATTASFGTLTGSRVVHNGTQFVAVGTGTATVNVKVSNDGITWATGPVGAWGSTAVKSFVWTGTNFVLLTSGTAVSVIYVGATMAALVAKPLPGPFVTNGYSALATNGLGKVCAASVSASLMLTSDDHGATWRFDSVSDPVYSNGTASTRAPLTLYEGKLRFYSVSTTGSPSIGEYNEAIHSFKRMSAPYGAFTPTHLAKSADINGPVYLLSCGNGTTTGRIFTSTDLVNWTLRSSPAATVRMILSSTWGCMAALHTGSTASSVTLLRSVDAGATWANMSGGAGFNAARLVYDPASSWVIGVGQTGVNGSIMGCGDGGTWISSYSASTENFTDVACGNGIVVAVSVGTGYKIFTNNTGSWVGRGLTTYQPLYCVAFCPANNTFYAGGANGAVYKSTDGITWVGIAISTTPIFGLVYDGVSAMYAMSQRGTMYKLDTK